MVRPVYFSINFLDTINMNEALTRGGKNENKDQSLNQIYTFWRKLHNQGSIDQRLALDILCLRHTNVARGLLKDRTTSAKKIKEMEGLEDEQLKSIIIGGRPHIHRDRQEDLGRLHDVLLEYSDKYLGPAQTSKQKIESIISEYLTIKKELINRMDEGIREASGKFGFTMVREKNTNFYDYIIKDSLGHILGKFCLEQRSISVHGISEDEDIIAFYQFDTTKESGSTLQKIPTFTTKAFPVIKEKLNKFFISCLEGISVESKRFFGADYNSVSAGS